MDPKIYTRYKTVCGNKLLNLGQWVPVGMNRGKRLRTAVTQALNKSLILIF